MWLLNTLLDSWETFRISHTNSAPNGVMTIGSFWNGGAGKSEDTGHVGTTTNDDLVIFDDNIINTVSFYICWVADTSAAVHVTSRRDSLLLTLLVSMVH